MKSGNELINQSNNDIVKIIFDDLETSLSFIEVLDHNPDRCFIVFLARVFNNTKNFDCNMILKVKKKEFPFETEINFEDLKLNLNKLINSPIQIFNNDIYYKIVSNDLVENKLKIDIVYPADQKVIDKYRKKGYVLFKETSQIYKEKTLNYIEAIDPNHTKWISNVLYNNTEKILVSHPEQFVVVQDYNSKDNENILNCLGIPFNNKIKSLRDLNSSHLELLENFVNAKESLAELFKVKSESIRCFVHYPPSFYYFHVHYLHTDYESNSTAVNRAWDLNSIIENIKLKSDYYQNITLEINIQIGSKLHSTLLN